jgi:hypothetical protein
VAAAAICGWCPTPATADTPWDRLSVVELRALLRDYPIDRTSLPAPIENPRRAKLVKTLRQVNGLYENTKDQRFTAHQ